MASDVSTVSPTRRRWLFAAMAAAGAAAGAGLAWRSMESIPPQGLDGLWQLQFDTPDGQTLAMQSLRGRPLLLNFWATWCPPCVEELPLLDKFFQENAANGWQVLGIAIDQKAAVQNFLRRAPVHFPVALGGLNGVELTSTLGNLSGGLPFSVVIGSKASVLQRKMGRIHADELRAWAELR